MISEAARDPYDIVNTFPIAAASLRKHADIRLNVSKSKILLVRSAPDLDPSRVPDGIDVVQTWWVQQLDQIILSELMPWQLLRRSLRS